MDINLNFNIGVRQIKANGILLIILLAATVLRFYGIGFQDVWLDEIHTLKESDTLLTLSEFHTVIMFREGIPHFYFLVLRYAYEIFGENIVVARSVSAISGIISVYFIYKLGKELFNKNAGYIAALFLTFNAYHIEYSQEARSYAMLAMFAVIANYYLIKFIKNNNIKTAVLLGLFTGLITNTHPIGLLNVAAIYLTVFIAMWMRDKNQRLTFFKQSFLSGMITLLVFWPVYQIVAKVSKATEFWVAAPTFDGIKAVLVNVSGRSVILLALFFFFFLLLAFSFIKNYKKTPNTLKLSFITLSVWVLMCTGVLIVKSYAGPSLILQRYFIGSLPAFMLIMAIGIQMIPWSIIRKSGVLIIIGILIAQILFPNNYYTTVTKSEFSKTAAEIVQNNPNSDKIVSNWGWLLGYFLDREGKIRNVSEGNLENYLEQVKNNAIDQENFWYVDGNSRPYNLSPELQDFVSKNYTISKSLDNHDAWAKHFISNKIISTAEVSIDLSRFSNSQYDGSRLMFFENSKSSYPSFDLGQGDYEILIFGNSMPDPPINNENAKMNIYINNALFKKVTLSEKNYSELKIPYTQISSGKVTFELGFTNDFAEEGKDRNIQISKIKFQKLNKTTE